VSDFIDVSKYSYITLGFINNGGNSFIHRIGLYDENKTFIKRIIERSTTSNVKNYTNVDIQTNNAYFINFCYAYNETTGELIKPDDCYVFPNIVNLNSSTINDIIYNNFTAKDKIAREHCEDNKNNLEKIINSGKEAINDFKLGSRADNGTINNSNIRLINTNMPKVSKGMYLIIQTQEIDALMAVLRIYDTNKEDGSASIIWSYDGAVFHTHKIRKLIKIECDGYLSITIKHHNDAAISVDENTVYCYLCNMVFDNMVNGKPWLNAIIDPELAYIDGIDNGDYYQAIQASINYIGANGTITFNKNKTYTISDTIVVPRTYTNMTFQGTSFSCHNPTIKASSDFSKYYMFEIQDSGSHFQDLTIQADWLARGIKFHRSTAINADEIPHLDATVIRCYLRFCIIGIVAFGKNCEIKECGFSNCNKGVLFRPASYAGTPPVSSRGWRVESCRFHSCGTHWCEENNVTHTSALFKDYDNIDTITDLMENGPWCIDTNNGAGHNIVGISIRNNVVDGGSFAGFYIGAAANLCLSNNVIFRDNINYILACVQGNTFHCNGVIQDNIVIAHVNTYWDKDLQNDYNHPLHSGNRSAIYVFRGANVLIKNNSFSDFAGPAINIQDCNKCIISNNIFDGVGYYTDTGIETGDAAKYICLNNNLFKYYNKTGTFNLIDNQSKLTVTQNNIIDDNIDE